MGVRRAPKPITDADIPAAIARDTEVTTAVNAHTAAADPHAQYLLQSEGDARYRQTAVALADADIPAAIARDAEVTTAINAHTAAADPHPSLWTRITNGFLALTGGQRVLRNNPVISGISYDAGQNHLEFSTNNGSNPILGFHRFGFSGTALYHAGHGNDSLRIRNADGYDSALLHDANHVNAPGLHSVRCSVISTIVAASGTETAVSIGAIPAAKIVGINAYILDNLGASGIFYIFRGGGEDFNLATPRLINGWIRIASVVAGSQFIGDPIHFLVWHIP